MDVRRRIALMFLCCLLCLALLAAPAKTDFLVGHVIKLEGNWRDQKCKCKIDQGHAIWGSSIIIRRDPAKSTSRLTIRLAATGTPETFDCAKVDCADPLDIQARVPKNEQPNRLSMFLRAALSVVEENLPGTAGGSRTVSGYARALSGRGIEPIPISDAIVPLHGGKPDISTVFAGVKPGTYLIEFCPIGKTGVYICPAVPEIEEFQWRADGKEGVSSRAMRPSLYELFLCQRQGNRILRRRESAFALVAASEQQAEAMRAEHQEFLKLMYGWAPKEVSMLQHAYLQHLNLTENR